MTDLPDTEAWSEEEDGPRLTVAWLIDRGRWPTCQQCGSVLWVGMRQTAKYCDAACRNKAYRARKKG